MLLTVVLFVVTFAYLYWDTQRKIFVALTDSDEMCGLESQYVTSLSVGQEKSDEPISKLAAFVVFWDRFKWAWPFLWDIFRLIFVPYLIQKLIAFVF